MYKRLTNWMFKEIDGVQLRLFRIFFGMLVMVECWGAIGTGWVKETFVEPHFTFPFIGFEWTQVLLGYPMYLLYAILGLAGLGIALGYRYRVSILLFSIGWSLTYWMQKSHYNNHYYLLMLISWIMVVMPANRTVLFNWQRYVFVAQMWIVYTYAAIAKLYPGWYSGQYLHLRLSLSAKWFEQHFSWYSFAALLKSGHFAQLLSWLGIGFDFLVIPGLLWKPTRKWMFLATLIFHIFNSVTLQIGIFPYFALALCVFCFPPELIRRRFAFVGIPASPLNHSAVVCPPHKKSTVFVFLAYLLWQIYLPLRHHLIPGDVLWTEEGHRMAWRMMLRSKAGRVQVYVKDKSTGERERVHLDKYLSPHQRSAFATSPDMIWQFAQYIRRLYQEKGKDIGVYVNSKVSVNGSLYYPLIDPEIDLTTVNWRYFSHQPWILDAPKGIYQVRRPGSSF